MSSYIETAFKKKALLIKEEKEKEQKLQSLIGYSRELITVMDANGIITFQSPSSKLILGYPPEELVGKSILDYLFEEKEAYELLLKGLKHLKTSRNIEINFKHKDGSKRYFEATINNLLHDSSINGIVINALDISEHKTTEAEFHKLHEIIMKTAESEGLNNSFYTLLKSLCDYMGFIYAEAWQLNQDISSSRSCTCWYSSQPEIFESFYDKIKSKFYSDRQGLVGKVVNCLEPVIIDNINTSTALLRKDSALEYGLNSAVAVPIISNNKILTVLVFFSDKIESISNRQLNFISIVAAQSGILIQRIKSQEKLRESEGNLKSIIDNLQDSFFRTDTNGMITFLNKNFFDLYGYKPQELIGISGDHVYVDVNERRKLYKELTENGYIKNFHASLRKKNGDIAYVLMNSKLRYNEEGSFIGTEGIIHDITEVRKQEASLRAVFETGRHYMLSMDRNCKVLDFNNNFYSAVKLKFGKELKKGFDFLSIVTENGKDKIKSAIEKALNGESSRVETFGKYDNITTQWFDNDFAPIKNANGDIEGVLLVSEDITFDKRKTEEIEQLYKALDESSNEVFIFDMETLKYKYANKGAIDNLGYTLEEIKSLSPFELKPGYTKKTFKTLIHPLVNGEKKQMIFESVHIRKDKTTYPVELHYSITDNDDNKLCFVVAVDITERKKHERDLKNKNKELKQVNFELDKFVYSASHDLKSPILSSIGLINLVRIETSDKDVLQYMDLMNKSLKKLDSFINDLIQFSRNSRLKVEKQKINFETLISDTFDNLKYMDESNRIKINTDIKIADSFYSDLSRISILMSNLMSNAIKYQKKSTETSYLNISINSTKKECTIVMKDNGIGIEKAYVNKIFKMFFRASELSKGSGLGLYIVKEIVKKLNGSITVKSTIGKGTEFKMVIPNQINKSTQTNSK